MTDRMGRALSESASSISLSSSSPFTQHAAEFQRVSADAFSPTSAFEQPLLGADVGLRASTSFAVLAFFAAW